MRDVVASVPVSFRDWRMFHVVVDFVVFLSVSHTMLGLYAVFMRQ